MALGLFSREPKHTNTQPMDEAVDINRLREENAEAHLMQQRESMARTAMYDPEGPGFLPPAEYRRMRNQEQNDVSPGSE